MSSNHRLDPLPFRTLDFPDSSRLRNHEGRGGLPAIDPGYEALRNDVVIANDLDVLAPGDDALPGRVLDGWKAVPLEEYSAARTAAGLP